MRRRLLSTFAAASLACAGFVGILWFRSYGVGEAIQWQSTRWADHDQRLSRTFAVLTRDGQLTLAHHHEDRRIVFRSRVSRDERDPGRTTFRWDANGYPGAPVAEPTLLNRFGFSKHHEAETIRMGRSRTSAQVSHRYSMPFWFLSLILMLPSVYWLCRRTRARARVPERGPFAGASARANP